MKRRADFLHYKPKELTREDVMGAMWSARIYLLQALQRDEALGQFYQETDDPKKVAKEYLRYFARQAEAYDKATGDKRLHFKVASPGELPEARENYHCMTRLMRRSDEIAIALLGEEAGRLYQDDGSR